MTIKCINRCSALNDDAFTKRKKKKAYLVAFQNENAWSIIEYSNEGPHIADAVDTAAILLL